MSAKKQILLLSLEDYSWLQDMYRAFLSSLRAKAFVTDCNSTDAAHEALTSGAISAVLVFEPAVMKRTHQALGKALSSYAKQGGTVIFAGCCSSHAAPPDAKKFFADCFQLPWTFGDYGRTTFTVNPEAALNIRAKLKESYSMKAVSLKNVSTEDLIYVTGPHSLLESHVFYPEKVDLVREGPVVFARYNEGKVGWVGDVNNEDATEPLVLAMLGI